jgi:ArsR family transcriptional regulator, arsenate/arsenite/antimonite-responsive transcriptional repressor
LTLGRYFNNHRNMKKPDAVAALAALAQDSRLDVFRLLVQAGPDGLPAGQVAAKLKLAPNTLTFHFDRLRDAGLVTVRRDGRSMIYATRFETMNALVQFLTENCCQGSLTGRAEECAPVAACAPAACAPAACAPAAAPRARRKAGAA